MLTTSMVDEYQVQASNNLNKKGLVYNTTVFLPSTQETYSELLNTDFDIYGLNLKFVRRIWRNQRDHEHLEKSSEKKILNSISFKNPCISEVFKDRIKFKINKKGFVNSVLLTSKTYIDENDYIDDTISLNAPLVIPLDIEIFVEVDQIIALSVEYNFARGYEHFKISII